MSKTKRIIAAVTAAIITATSTSLMSVCADDNGGSDLGFISKSTTDKSDKIEKVESDAQLYDKLGQLLKQGDLLKYGEALYTTGTPDGEKWTKEFYEQRVEFFGKDLLSKYIVDGEFLRKSVESDMNGLLIKTANELDKYVDVINEFLTEKSIAGSAYLIKNDGIDKLLITYDGNLDKIKTFVNETGLDENLVVYSQAEDMVVTKPAATIAVTETKPATTITMPVLAEPNVKASVATVKIMDVSGDTILVKPVDGSIELKSSDKFSLSAKQLPADITPKAGMMLEITYNGGILETYPAMFDNIQKVTVVTESDTVKEDVTFLKGTKDMTMKDVIELAKKGSDLDWADFKDYNGRDIGSGLYIWEYKLEDGYVLDVGGTIDKKPLYILLSHDDDKGIDIRTDDVEKYLSDSAQVSNIKGDANCDGQVDLSDAVMIMQALANPNKYGIGGTAEHHLTEQGKLNSDMDGDGLTVGDALAIQRKLLGLYIAVAQSIDSSLIANKVFTYEKSADPGIYDDLCDLSFGSNGTYVYHIGYYTSSNQDQGTWEISGDTLVLTGQYGTNKFRYEDKALIYIAEESDGFSEFNDKSTPKDGEKFILAPERTYDVQTKSMNDVTVSIKSDLRPHMSDLSGIGILLDVKSNDYPVTLKATDGNFVEWDIEKGSGPVKTVGKEYDIGKNGYIFWNPDKLYYQDGFESEIQVIGVSGDVFIDVGKIYVSQVKGGIFEASFEKPSPSASTDNSVIAGKIFAYEKEGAGGYCTLSFNENGRFLYSPGKLSSYMGGGDWKIDGDTVSLIGMVDKTIYLKITDDTLVYIAEGSDEFPYMDIKDGEKFGIYRPEISSDYFQLNSRYSEYGLGNPKVELDLMAFELPEFCYVENVKLYDEDDNFIGMMSPAMDANIWGYLVDCNVTEECSKTYYTLTKIRCGEKTYLDDVRSEITVNFKGTPAP